ncbi:MAG: hypothetical protein IPP57_06305 [Candidatus Obscuribacter sp.]|nr:hypothetical protein [Candidatus Obscuribacter sp.]
MIISEYKVNLFARKTIARGQRTIYIDIYQFDQSAGALAAYYYLRKGATTVIKRGDASSEEDDSISFCQGTLLSLYMERRKMMMNQRMSSGSALMGSPT